MDQMFRNVNVSKVLSSRRKYWNIFIMLAFPSRHMKPSIYIFFKRFVSLATYTVKTSTWKNIL